MKKVKKPLFMVLVVLLAGIAISRSGIHAEVSQDALARAFRLVNASNVTINLNTFGKLSDSYATREQLQHYVRQIMTVFDTADAAIAFNEHSGYREAKSGCRPTEDTLIEVIVQSLPAEDGALPETDVVINITTTDGLESLSRYRRQLESCLKHLGCSSPIHCTIMGVVEGEISNADITRLIEQVLEELRCKTTDFYADQNVVSTSAFSPCLPQNPYGWDFNLQLAIRRGPESGQYSVWLGWPALGSPY